MKFVYYKLSSEKEKQKMKYPINCKNIVDVTKPPYNADNTGKTDCTKALIQAFDDLMIREIIGVKETYEKLQKMSDNGKNTVLDGFENRVYNSSCPEVGTNVIYPEFVPSSRIIYFPAGTYLVSDTITYTFDNLKNIYLSKPYSELARGIHFMGENSENTVIKLADNSKGFEKGTKKPVIAFVNDFYVDSNVTQLNTIEDISIDCGNGNPGAVGIRFKSINSGRIQNMNITANEGYCGILTPPGVNSSFVDINVSGFDYGMVLNETSVTVLDKTDVSGCKIAGINSGASYVAVKEINSGNIPTFEFRDGVDTRGTYYFTDKNTTIKGSTCNNKVYYENEPVILRDTKIPENVRSTDANDWACVDDFGAIGDGKTDATEAIQKAFNSGKEVIVFGEGHYFVNGEISIPKTVKTIDFMFCDFFSGENLINDKNGALFVIDEESDDILFMENLYTFEQFYGHFRLIKHAAKRDLVMSDIHTQASATYFNTVGGSKIYMDNCASTTGTYSYNCVLAHPGEYEDFCDAIPYEFHGQTVYGMQVNPERADIEILNDNSTILIDAFKVEGPGTAVKTINGGKTRINICTCGIGFTGATNALFETNNAHTEIVGARMGDVLNSDLKYQYVIEEDINGVKNKVHKRELPDVISEAFSRINYYNSDNIDLLS